MAVEHSCGSSDHDHSAAGRRGSSRVLAVLSIPIAPLRWAVVGCLGLAVFGMILPFSPIPPCPLLTATGVPCPFCGMTRSVRALLRFDLADSVRFQPLGMLAGLVAIVVLAMWALPRTRSIAVLRVPVAVVVLAVVGSWIWNIGFNPTFS